MNEMNIEEKISGTAFSIFMRQLHILALVQHSTYDENMNYRSMADLLSSVPWDEDVDEKKISRCVVKLKDMGFPVHTAQGEPRVMLDRELSENEMMELLPYYINVVSDTMGIRDCFKSYVANHGTRSLWIIARIYFASLEKRSIELTYQPLSRPEPEVYTVNPYRWVYRDNAVYLVARNTVREDNISLFRINRIRDMKITGRTFNDAVPSSAELLKYSMGSFIGSRHYEVKLRFNREERGRIEEDFGHLDLKFLGGGADGWCGVTFMACDLINVCIAVFSYSGSVKIIEPPEAIEQMKRMISGNAAHY